MTRIAREAEYYYERKIAFALVDPTSFRSRSPGHRVLGIFRQRRPLYAQRIKKPAPRKVVLRLPDLDHAKSAVLNSLSSPRSRRNYKFAMEQFITWYCSEARRP